VVRANEQLGRGYLPLDARPSVPSVSSVSFVDTNSSFDKDIPSMRCDLCINSRRLWVSTGFDDHRFEDSRPYIEFDLQYGYCM
jgi:hypothetical protein